MYFCIVALVSLFINSPIFYTSTSFNYLLPCIIQLILFSSSIITSINPPFCIKCIFIHHFSTEFPRLFFYYTIYCISYKSIIVLFSVNPLKKLNSLASIISAVCANCFNISIGQSSFSFSPK